jgi:plastocyanin
MNTRSKLWIVGLVLILTTVAAACGRTSEPTPAPTSQPASAPAPAVGAATTPLPTAESEARLEIASDIKDFTLADLTVEVGTRVAWTNRDSARHTSTSGSQGSKAGFWDSPLWLRVRLSRSHSQKWEHSSTFAQSIRRR